MLKGMVLFCNMRLQDLANAVDAKVADITTKVVQVQSVFSKHLLSFSSKTIYLNMFSLLKGSRIFNQYFRARKITMTQEMYSLIQIYIKMPRPKFEQSKEKNQ